MNRFIRLTVIPLLFYAPVAGQEKKLDPEIRHFANIVDWAFQKAEPESRLRTVVGKLAQESDLPPETTKLIQPRVPQILQRFRIEKATHWSTTKDVRLVNRESKMLRQSTVLIEESAAFKVQLARLLTPEQLERWNSFSTERNAKEIRRLEALSKDTKLAATLRRARAKVALPWRPFTLFPDEDRELSLGQSELLSSSVKRVVAAKKEVIRLSFERKQLQIEAYCELSPPQKRRLDLAIRGLVVRNLRHLGLSLLTAESINPREANDLMNKVRTPVEISKADEDFWKKSVDSTLTSAQKKTIEQSKPQTK